jgi:hypothetical protein
MGFDVIKLVVSLIFLEISKIGKFEMKSLSVIKNMPSPIAR